MKPFLFVFSASLVGAAAYLSYSAWQWADSIMVALQSGLGH